eukprot:108756-Prymnesium_polylepis.1
MRAAMSHGARSMTMSMSMRVRSRTRPRRPPFRSRLDPAARWTCFSLHHEVYQSAQGPALRSVT